jgi:predicted ATPase
MGPQWLEKLHVKGFKTFADAAVDLKSCNILIGGNGAGKSSFLSLLRMLRALARGEFELFVEKAGRANDVLRRAIPSTARLEIGVHFAGPTGKGRYHLSADRTEDDRLLMRSEEIEPFDQAGGSFTGGIYKNPVRESVFSLPAQDQVPKELVFFSLMQPLSGLRAFHFVETAVMAPASFEGDFGDNRELRQDGANLAAYLFYLQNYQNKTYRLIVETIRLALAGFGDFVLQPSKHSPPTIRLRWRMKGMEGDFGAHQFSDGTLRFVLLATLLSQPPDHLPSIIAIDEPKLGLHPAALNLVVSLIRVASHHSQIFVATQSAALVDCFEPEDVIVVHRRDGASTLERLSSEPLQEWLAEYSLGELWEKNVVGGGPFG